MTCWRNEDEVEVGECYLETWFRQQTEKERQNRIGRWSMRAAREVRMRQGQTRQNNKPRGMDASAMQHTGTYGHLSYTTLCTYALSCTCLVYLQGHPIVFPLLPIPRRILKRHTHHLIQLVFRRADQHLEVLA